MMEYSSAIENNEVMIHAMICKTVQAYLTDATSLISGYHNKRDWVEREGGGGIRMENTCKSMADSCQCMAKNTTIL